VTKTCYSYRESSVIPNLPSLPSLLSDQPERSHAIASSPMSIVQCTTYRRCFRDDRDSHHFDRREINNQERNLPVRLHVETYAQLKMLQCSVATARACVFVYATCIFRFLHLRRAFNISFSILYAAPQFQSTPKL
jgi:hypothetical protein